MSGKDGTKKRKKSKRQRELERQIDEVFMEPFSDRMKIATTERERLTKKRGQYNSS